MDNIMARIKLAAAVNDEAVLENNLLASDDIKSGALSLQCYRGYKTAASVYNQAISDLGDHCDWIGFVHQDVYLPNGFLENLSTQLDNLISQDDSTAIVGFFGAISKHKTAGRVWCSANSSQFTGVLTTPAPIDILDEYFILMKTDKGLAFDTDLPGFHLFGTDICLEAKSRNYSCWVIDVPVVHNSRRVVTLDRYYRQAWLYLRKKWAQNLPIYNLVCPITHSKYTLWRRYLQIRRKNNFRNERGEMLDDPAKKASELGYQ